MDIDFVFPLHHPNSPSHSLSHFYDDRSSSINIPLLVKETDHQDTSAKLNIVGANNQGTCMLHFYFVQSEAINPFLIKE
jgi:hypothetical protein